MLFNVIVILVYIFIGTWFLKLKDKDSYHRKKQYVIIVSVILILQSGLRNLAVGEDTYGYYQAFVSADTRLTYSEVIGNFTNYIEIGSKKGDVGYIFMEKFFCDILNGNFRIFLFLIAILFFFSLGRFILSNTRKLSDIMLSYVIYSVLFFSFYSITGLRQTIAMSIIMFTIPYVKKNNLWMFLLLLILAASIHKSALVFISFYFINRFNTRAKYIFIFSLLLFPLIMSFKGEMLNFFQSFIGYENYQQFEGAGTFTFTTLFLLISVLTYFRRSYLIFLNPNSSFYFNALSLCLVLIPLSWINPNLIRIVMYFSLYIMVIIPELLNSMEFVSRRFVQELKIFTVVVLIVLYARANSNFEYGFVWDNMNLHEGYYR